jgi:nucleoside-diphosphate-sugar epimerase
MRGRSNVLITGSTGFIGSHLISMCIKNSINFRVLTRRPNAQPSYAKYIILDSCSNTQLFDVIKGASIVVHLIGLAHELQGKISIEEYKRINVEMTRRLAEQSALAGVDHFIFLSSAKAFGERTFHDKPMKENSEPYPESDYGLSKLLAERALLEVERANPSMKVTIIRPPLVYGQGVKANFLRLVKLANSSFPLPLGALHDAKKSFICVDNLCDFIFHCISDQRSKGEAFFISDGHDLSTVNLLNLIGDAVGKSTKLIKVPIPLLCFFATLSGQSAALEKLSNSLVLDISKARNYLGWKPVISVEDAIRKAVAICDNDFHAHI